MGQRGVCQRLLGGPALLWRYHQQLRLPPRIADQTVTTAFLAGDLGPQCKSHLRQFLTDENGNTACCCLGCSDFGATLAG